MTLSCISNSTTKYDFFVFPAEIRNMIYHHLLQASYTGVGQYPSHRHSPLLFELRIERGKYRPESDRLSILRVARQIRYEAMCFLYRHSTFCFEVQSPWEAAPGGLGVEALSLIQFVDIRVDTGLFMHPSGVMKEEKRFAGQLRGLGGSKVSRKRCHVTLDCCGDSANASLRRVVCGLKTLTNFELVILDANLHPKADRDEYEWAPSTWKYFDYYARKLKMELGAGGHDMYDGHYCLAFHPMEERDMTSRAGFSIAFSE